MRTDSSNAPIGFWQLTIGDDEPSAFARRTYGCTDTQFVQNSHFSIGSGDRGSRGGRLFPTSGILGLGGIGLFERGRAVGDVGGKLAGLHVAVQFRAFFNGNLLGLDVPIDARGAPDLDAFDSSEFAFDAAPNNHFARRNFGLDGGVGANGDRGVGDGDFAVNLPVDEEILTAGDFALDPDALANTCGGFRGGCWCESRKTGAGRSSEMRRSCRYARRALRLFVFFTPHGDTSTRNWISKVAFGGRGSACD